MAAGAGERVGAALAPADGAPRAGQTARALQAAQGGVDGAGDIDAIAAHGLIGSLLAAAGLVLIGLTLLYVLAGRGRLWVVPAGVVLFLAIGIQVGAGYSRDLALHVPLGVAVVPASVLLGNWVWSPSAGRSR